MINLLVIFENKDGSIEEKNIEFEEMPKIKDEIVTEKGKYVVWGISGEIFCKEI